MKIKPKTPILFAMLFTFIVSLSLFGQDLNEDKLRSAVLYEDISEVKKVLAEGADINSKDTHGYTVLIRACSYSSDENYREKAKLLISEGAEVNIQAVDGNTALIEAAGNSQEVFDLLIAKGADINVQKMDGTGAFYQCMLGMLFYDRANMELAEFLLSKGTDVNEAPTEGELKGFTTLIFAARENNTQLVKFLIEHGANVNAITDKGDSALSLAEKKEYIEIINILKANGAK